MSAEQIKMNNYCGCNSNMDIRGRCDYVYNKKMFKKCSARLDTTYFHLMNDYETYKKIEQSKTEKQKKEIIRKFCHHVIGLKSLYDKSKVFEMYKDERKDEDNGKCVCEECKKEIDFTGHYEYDDDTGFYLCGDCMPNRDDEDEDEYMNELIICVKCNKGIKRKDMKWTDTGCAYTEVCQVCDDKEKHEINIY